MAVSTRCFLSVHEWHRDIGGLVEPHIFPLPGIVTAPWPRKLLTEGATRVCKHDVIPEISCCCCTFWAGLLLLYVFLCNSVAHTATSPPPSAVHVASTHNRHPAAFSTGRSASAGDSRLCGGESERQRTSLILDCAI